MKNFSVGGYLPSASRYLSRNKWPQGLVRSAKEITPLPAPRTVRYEGFDIPLSDIYSPRHPARDAGLPSLEIPAHPPSGVDHEIIPGSGVPTDHGETKRGVDIFKF